MSLSRPSMRVRAAPDSDGSRRSTRSETLASDAAGDRLRRYPSPLTRSRKNGTAASRMLNAMPLARKKMLSSPLLSQTRRA
jgi:hypothetical protein